MIRSRRNILTAALAAVLLLLGASGQPVSAADRSQYAGINIEDRDCQVSVTLVDQDEYEKKNTVCVDGAELSLYKVADLNPDGTYSLKEEFSGVDGWDAYISGGSTEDAITAASSAQSIVLNAGVPAGSQVTTDGSGAASFSVSEYGIYLVSETGKSGTAANYSDMAPVLVQVPMWDGSAWNYEITLQPKMAENNGFTITILKRRDEKGRSGERVAGARLRITDEQGNVVVPEWTTAADHDYVTDRLKPGSYILEEVEAPAEYETADPIAFTVTRDGKILVGGQQQSSASVTMLDKLKPVTPETETETETETESVTETETETTKQPVTEPSTKDNQKPAKTGDSMNVAIFASLFAIAVSVLVLLLVGRKKNKKER